MNLLRLIRIESFKRGLLLSVIFNIISKGALFVLTICIAGIFGSNIKTDIYFFVYGTMILLSGFINTVDIMVLVPVSMRLQESEGRGAAMVFLNYFLRIYILIGLVFTVVMLLFGTDLFGFFSKFPATTILVYKNYFLAGSIYFIFQLLTNYINNILTSLKFFTVPLIINGVNSVVIIAGIFLLYQRFDVLSIFISGIIAYSINLIILFLFMRKIAGWNFFTRGGTISKAVRNNILYTEMGQLTTLASSFLPLFLLSGLGKGVISMMNYGKNIADIPNTLFTAQVANVSGIKLNEQMAREELMGVNDTFQKTAKLLILILVPVGCYMIVFARPIVELFYERGNFDPGSINEVVGFMRLLTITIFSIGVNSIVSRVFIAAQALKQAFLYQLIMNIILIITIGILVLKFGAFGYPYGVLLINSLNFLLMYLICKKIVPFISYASVLRFTGIVLIINVLIATGIYLLFSNLQMALLPKLLLGFLLYLTVLLPVVHIFRVNTAFTEFIKYAKERFS